jgi:hypothetical protein
VGMAAHVGIHTVSALTLEAASRFMYSKAGREFAILVTSIVFQNDFDGSR